MASDPMATKWCDCDEAVTADRDPDAVLEHEITCLYGGELKRKALKDRCRCWHTPTLANGAISLNEHDDDCGFPLCRCDNDQHRTWVHRACGRLVRMRFCGCTGSDPAFTWNEDRGWWVHYVCGWPARGWFELEGRAAPLALEGAKPVTYHEYRVIPKNPARPYRALSDLQREWNGEAASTWVWD